MIQVSKDTEKIAKKFGLTVEQLAFADLLSAGWDSTDAYAVTIRTGSTTWTKKALSDEIKRLEALEGVKTRIEDIKSRASKEYVKNVQDKIKTDRKQLLKRATSKEDTLIECQAVLDSKTPGSPDWIKIKSMIIDVSMMKKEEIKNEDSTVHYYLPVAYPTSCKDCLRSRCKQCKYYIKYNKEHEKHDDM